MLLAKRIFGITCAKNCKTALKFVKVIQEKNKFFSKLGVYKYGMKHQQKTISTVLQILQSMQMIQG